jgi:hypothetical protein
MKLKLVSATILGILFSCGLASAQDKPGATQQSAEPSPVPLKIQIVISEYDGPKKIASLPYAIPVIANPLGDRGRVEGQMRAGVRVPITSYEQVTGTQTEQRATTTTYQDVGTSIDCYVRHLNSERYSLEITIDRSSLYVYGSSNEAKEWVPGEPRPSNQPLIHQYRGSFSLYLKDGEKGEETVATDPITGHVFKAEVSLNVIK